MKLFLRKNIGLFCITYGIDTPNTSNAEQLKEPLVNEEQEVTETKNSDTEQDLKDQSPEQITDNGKEEPLHPKEESEVKLNINDLIGSQNNFGSVFFENFKE